MPPTQYDRRPTSSSGGSTVPSSKRRAGAPHTTSTNTNAALVDTQHYVDDDGLDVIDPGVLNELEGVLHERASRHLNRLQEYMQALRDISTTAAQGRGGGGGVHTSNEESSGRRTRSPWMPKGPWYGGRPQPSATNNPTTTTTTEHSPYCCPCVLCTCGCHGGTRGGGTDVSVPRSHNSQQVRQLSGRLSSQQWSPPPPLRRASSRHQPTTPSSSVNNNHPISRKTSSVEATAALLLGNNGDSPLRLTGDHRANTLRLLRRWMRKRGEGSSSGYVSGDSSGLYEADEEAYNPRHAHPHHQRQHAHRDRSHTPPTMWKPESSTSSGIRTTAPAPQRQPSRRDQQQGVHPPTSTTTTSRPIPPGLNRSVPQPLPQYYSDEEEEWDTDDDAFLSSETPEWSSPPVADVTPLRPPEHNNKPSPPRSTPHHQDPHPATAAKQSSKQQQQLQQHVRSVRRPHGGGDTTHNLPPTQDHRSSSSRPTKQYRPHRNTKVAQQPVATSAPRHPSVSPYYDEDGDDDMYDGNPNTTHHRDGVLDGDDDDRAGSTHLSETTSFVSDGSISSDYERYEEEEYEEEEDNTPTVRGSAPNAAAASRPPHGGGIGTEVLMTMGSPVGKGKGVVDTRPTTKPVKRRVNNTGSAVEVVLPSVDDSEELRGRLAALEAALYGHARRPPTTTPIVTDDTHQPRRLPADDDTSKKSSKRANNLDGDDTRHSSRQGGSNVTKRGSHKLHHQDVHEHESEGDVQESYDDDNVSQTSNLEGSTSSSTSVTDDEKATTTPQYEEGAMPNSRQGPNPQPQSGHPPPQAGSSSTGSSRYWQQPPPSSATTNPEEEFTERQQRRAQRRHVGVPTNNTNNTSTNNPQVVVQDGPHRRTSSSSITGPMSSPHAPLVMPFSQQAPPSINHSTMSSQTGTLLPNPYVKSVAPPTGAASTASQPPSSANTSFSVVYGATNQYTTTNITNNNASTSTTFDHQHMGRGGRVSHMATPNLTPIVKRSGGNNNRMGTTHAQGGTTSMLEEMSEMSIQESSWMGGNPNNNNNGASHGIQFTQVTAKYSPGRAYTTILRQSSSPIREAATTTTTTTSSSSRRFHAVSSTGVDDDDNDDAEVDHNPQHHTHYRQPRPLSHQYDDDIDDDKGEYNTTTTDYDTTSLLPQGEVEANFVSLGLTLSNRREQLGLPGVHVHRVAPNSPADLVGLRPNDIIVEWNPKVDGDGEGGVFQVHRLAHIEELVQMQASEGVSELEIVFLNHLRVHPSMMMDGPTTSPHHHHHNTSSSSVAYTVGSNNNNNASTTSSHPPHGSKKDGGGGGRVHAARRGVITIEGGSLYPTARNKRREPYQLPGVSQPRHECPHEEHPFQPQCLTKYRSPSTTSSTQRRR